MPWNPTFTCTAISDRRESMCSMRLELLPQHDQSQDQQDDRDDDDLPLFVLFKVVRRDLFDGLLLGLFMVFVTLAANLQPVVDDDPAGLDASATLGARDRSFALLLHLVFGARVAEVAAAVF